MNPSRYGTPSPAAGDDPADRFESCQRETVLAGNRLSGISKRLVVADLNAVSRCESEPQPFDFRDGAIGFDVTLPPLRWRP
jgi:hypothetical protein